jgi:CheY-like chemotaxis protein
MPAQRVLVVDENQTFCNQVVAAFSEAGIDARGSARGNEALMLAASFRPDVVVVDLVRPGSEGRWLLGRLCAQNDEVPVALVPRAVLALAPVAGDYSDLPDGVEVMVKPIFPSQVVASARRLLGPLSGHPLGAGPLSGGRPPRPVVKTPSSLLPPPLPRSGSLSPSEQMAIEHTAPPGGRPLDPFDDDSDFGPADTLLAPAASISELARSMALIPDSAPRPRPRPEVPAPTGSDGGEATMPLFEFNLRGDTGAAAEAAARPRPSTGARPPASGLGLSPSAAEREALTGSLAAVPIIDVLSLLARQCQTGILRVVAASAERQFELVLRGGQLEQAVALGLPSLRLGRFVLELETLRQPELDAVDAARGKRARPTGEDGEEQTGVPMDADQLLGGRLVAAGLLSRDELRQALQRQTIELLYEALRLPSGRFTFIRTRELPRWAVEPDSGAALGLDLEALLLEGARRADGWYQLDLDTTEGAVYVSTLAPDQELRQLGLSQGECAVLLLCNGRNSVGEIAKQSRLALLDVSRTLGRLLSLRLCRRRLPVVLAS